MQLQFGSPAKPDNANICVKITRYDKKTQFDVLELPTQAIYTKHSYKYCSNSLYRNRLQVLKIYLVGMELAFSKVARNISA